MSNIIKNTSLYAVGNILPQIAGFVLLPIYTNYLSPADYEIINSMVVLQSILIIFFTLCLERSMFRLYWDYKTEADKKVFLGTITISILGTSIIFFILLFMFNQYVNNIFKTIEFFPFYAIAITTSLISTFSMVPKQLLMLNEKAGAFVKLSLLQFIFNTCFIIWELIFKGNGPIGYLRGLMLGNLILSPVFIFISFKSIAFRFNFSMFKAVAKFSLPIIPALLAGWVINLSDRIFIERYFTLSDVGVYSLGYKIAGLVTIISGAWGLAYTPIFFKLANSKNQILAKSKISSYNNSFLVVIILIFFSISFFSKEIIILLFNEKYYDSYKVIPLISFSYLFSMAGGITSRYFQQSKKMLSNMYISVFAATLNVLFNFLLIPVFGTFGAAYATIISLSIPFFISYLYTKNHCYFVPINWKSLLPIFITLTTLLLFFHYCLQLPIFLSLTIKGFMLVIFGLLFLKKYSKHIKTIMAGA